MKRCSQLLSTFALLTIMACGYSCSRSDTSTEVVTVEYGSRPDMLFDYVESYEVVLLDNDSNEAIISSIDRMIFVNDKIFIFDRRNQRVVLFDKSGKFLRSTQNMIGRGPNEYIQAIDMAYDRTNNQLLLYTDIPYSVLRFDENLKLASNAEKSEGYFDETVIDDKYTYSIVPASYNNKPNEDYLVVTENGGKERVLLKALNEVANCDAVGKSLTSTDGVYVGRRFDNNIYRLDNGAIAETISFDFGELNFPDSYKNTKMNSNQFINECVMKYVISLKDITATKSYLFFSCNLPWMFIYNKGNGTCRAIKLLIGMGLSPSIPPDIIPASGLDNSIVLSYPQSNLLRLRDNLMRPDYDRSGIDKDLIKAAEDEDYDNHILIIAKLKE